MGELAAKLARKSFFGEYIMQRSSVHGFRGQQPLPQDKLGLLKETICSLVPQYAGSPHLFEAVWQKCVGAINHACSKLRNKNQHQQYLNLTPCL